MPALPGFYLTVIRVTRCQKPTKYVAPSLFIFFRVVFLLNNITTIICCWSVVHFILWLLILEDKNTVGRSEEFTSATNWNVTQLTTHTNRRPSQLFRQVVKILRFSVFLAMVWKYVPCRSKSNAICAFKDRRHILLRHNLSTNGVVFTLADGNRTKRISKVKHQ